MKCYVLGTIIITFALFSVTAYGEPATAKLEIKVFKRTLGDKNPKPFPGVGVFALLRGHSKLDGASCPDISGATGSVNCTIPCSETQNTPVIIRVKPPSDQDHLAGWVTPPAQDIELLGCKLAPQVVSMKYDDAKYALNELIIANKYAAASSPDGKNPDQWIAVFKTNPALPARTATVATATAKGRGDLVRVYQIASEGAKEYDPQASKLTGDEIEQSQAFMKWLILSKSALLGSKLERIVPASSRGTFKFQPTNDKATYLSNLKQADDLLSGIKDKTPDQLKFADDIKTLQSMPASGNDAQSALPIIQQWK